SAETLNSRFSKAKISKSANLLNSGFWRTKILNQNLDFRILESQNLEISQNLEFMVSKSKNLEFRVLER
ncbi:unnamed protein product, partial [Porites evermanni]